MSDSGERSHVDDRSPAVWRATISVLPKAGVNDPEGEAILGGLHGLGFDQVRRVRAGRLCTVDLAATSAAEATAQATAMAERLLANPVIQRFTIDRVESVADEG